MLIVEGSGRPEAGNFTQQAVPLSCHGRMANIWELYLSTAVHAARYDVQIGPVCFIRYVLHRYT